MHIEKVEYKKVFNLGNFSNEQIGVTVTLAPSENPLEAFAEAKRQVEKSHQFFVDQPNYQRALKIIASPDDYTGREVKQAKEAIEVFEANYPDFIAAFIPINRQLKEADHDDVEDDHYPQPEPMPVSNMPDLPF